MLSPKTQPLLLEEGGATQLIEFQTFLPPSVYCLPADLINNGIARVVLGLVFNLRPDCVVTVQMTTSNYLYALLPYVPSREFGQPKLVYLFVCLDEHRFAWHQ